MLRTPLPGIARRIRQLREFAAAGHRSVFAQLIDIVWLRLRGNNILFDEYYTLGLANKTLHPDRDLASYAGRNLKNRVHNQLNNSRWEGMVTDKFIQYSLLKSHHVPHPCVQALVTPHIERSAGDIPSLRTNNQISEFLLEQAKYPFFCKSVKGSFGHGAMRADGIDRTTHELIMADGKRLSIDNFYAAMRQSNRFGMLIQDAAQPNSDLTPMIGNVVSGLRLTILVGDDGPQHFRTAWKLPVAGNIVDNYDNGATGNLVADVDVSDGRVRRVVGGFSANATVNPLHPDTGKQLLGITIPFWLQITETVFKAATCFPGFRWQNWDIGITETGPTVFELNSAGGVSTIQVAPGRGIMDDELRTFIARYGALN